MRRTSSIAPQRALDLGLADRRGVDARRPRRAPSARARGPACRRPRARAASRPRGRRRRTSLSPLYSRSCVHARRAAGPRRARRARRSRRCARRSAPSSSSSASVLRQLASSWPRRRCGPRAGPAQPSIADQTSPLRPPVPGTSPTASQSSPWRDGDRVDRLEHGLLVGAALGGRARRARRRPRRLLASRPAAWRPRACRPAICSFIALQAGRPAARRRGLITASVPALKSASGLCASAEENCLQQVLAHPRRRPRP